MPENETKGIDFEDYAVRKDADLPKLISDLKEWYKSEAPKLDLQIFIDTNDGPLEDHLVTSKYPDFTKHLQELQEIRKLNPNYLSDLELWVNGVIDKEHEGLAISLPIGRDMNSVTVCEDSYELTQKQRKTLYQTLEPHITKMSEVKNA